MQIVPSRKPNNYFVSIDFFLRTALFLIATLILILQHALSYCKLPARLVDVFTYEYFSPSFGTDSWSATGLYVTCWAMIILYIHTVSLVFWDNFHVQSHATAFVIEDLITAIFFLAWTTTNIIQLSDCSQRQLSSDRNETQQRFENPFCGSAPCSFFLAPSIASFIAMFVAISLAAAAFPKIQFYKIPRYIRDNNQIRTAQLDPIPSNVLAFDNASSNKQFYPLPKFEAIERQRTPDADSARL